MNLKKLLTSLAVTVMLTDVLLLALAFAPATVTNGFSNHKAQSAMVQQSATPQVLLAGTAPTQGQNLVQPAWKFWNWLRRCGACVFSDTDETACSDCVHFRDRKTVRQK